MEKRTTELRPHVLNEKLYGTEELPESFIANVRDKGILVPLIIKPDGTIISGHRRWCAAQAVNMDTVPVQIVEYQSELDEREAVIDFNRQREKTFSQRMAEAEELKAVERERARERQGTRTDKNIPETFPESTGETRNKVAEKIGIGSGRTYEKAAKVWEAAQKGNEEARKLVEQIDKGRTTIHSAYRKIKHKPEKEPPELPQGRYDVILADPPWRYDFAETRNRAIENQYPTMTLEKIKALEVPSAENAALFLWATAPKLLEALEVIEAWGFGYRTCAVWDKEKIGMGYWFRGQHELLLVGTKGDFAPPAEKDRFASVIRETRTSHSTKPECLYEMLERMFPHARFIELFARHNSRPRWAVWGNEA